MAEADGQSSILRLDGTAPYQVSWTGTAMGDPAGDETTARW